MAATVAAAMVFGGSAVAVASTGSLGSVDLGSTSKDDRGQQLTEEQIRFIEERLGASGPDGTRTMDAPANLNSGSAGSPFEATAVPAVVIGGAAWCASGALGSIPTSVLDDLANGGAGVPYARNAIIGCLAGNLGGLAWRVLPGWLKEKAIAAVAAFIIRYIR